METAPLARERTEIVARLRQLNRQGLPLKWPEVRKRNARLHMYATHIWSWGEALAAAGIANPLPGFAAQDESNAQAVDPIQLPAWPPRQYAGKEDVLDGIHIRTCLELPLSLHAVGRGENRDRNLLNAAIKHFESWQKAVATLGIKYENVRRPDQRYSTRHAVVNEILNRKGRREPLLSSGLLSGPHRDISLYKNALRLFGRWKDALDCARLNVPGAKTRDHGRYGTKEAVIRELQRCHKLHMKLTTAAFFKGPQANPPLVYNARRLFESWNEAIKNAGISDHRRKYPTKSAIITELKRRRAAGLPVSAGGLQHGRKKDPLLYRSLWREFKGIKSALKAAELT